MSAFPWEILGLGWLVAALVMFALWCLQPSTRNATAVDIAWAANLGLLALLYAALADGALERRIATAVIVASASVRLAGHLFVDRARGKSEDGRYRILRAKWGARANRNFFWFFQAQAALDALLSVTFLLACTSSAPLRALDFAAFGLWFVALLGEALADRQLARFKADSGNQGRTCRVGLWRYSRHPNYFFEWFTWIAYALLAFAAPFGWLAFSSPLAMLFLIVKVTGIPPTEAQALKSRGDDYRDYQRTTSAFVPWFPRRRAA